MPAGFGDEYWAMFAEEYVELCTDPNQKDPYAEMARRHNLSQLALSTYVARLRSRHGMLEPFVSHREPPRLTDKALGILGIERPKEPLVKFTVEITAANKIRALAQVWDIVQQLEHWDDRSGQPFTLNAERLKDLEGE